MTSPLYWALFTVAFVAVFAGPRVCAWLEDRADQHDAEVWSRMPGAVR